MNERIHVFIGTKAQYVKTAPLLRLMDDKAVDYRLIDSGQHAALSVGMRADLGVRQPDHVLGGAGDVESVPQAIRWAGGLAAKLVSGRRLRREVFGGDGGVCVIHGDTPTTLLTALMARRAGLRVAHLEAGLRSHSLLHPFPEEAIRLVAMRLAHVLFAPDDTAVGNLRRMWWVRGRVVPLAANTSVEALRYALARGGPLPDARTGPVIVLMHRVENLQSRRTVADLVDTVTGIARRGQPVRWLLHGLTRDVLAKRGHDRALNAAGVELVPLAPHHEFMRMLAAAPFAIIDGGSIQEECALLGVPTLVWRKRTERPHGLGENVVLSGHDRIVVDAFLDAPEQWRRPAVEPVVSPSEQILEVLLGELRQ